MLYIHHAQSPRPRGYRILTFEGRSYILQLPFLGQAQHIDPACLISVLWGLGVFLYPDFRNITGDRNLGEKMSVCVNRGL